MTPEPDEERVALAGEYVLGLLEPEEVAQVEDARPDDPAFDRAIGEWETRLAELDGLAAPLTPEVWLWSGIEASIAKLAPAEAEASAAPAATRAGRGRGTTASSKRSKGLWRSLPFWRMTTLAAACAAATIFVLSLRTAPEIAGEAVAVAFLDDEDGRTGWLVNVFANAPMELIPLAPTEVPQNQALELWTLRDEQEGPLSLGLIAPSGTQRREARRLGPPRDGQIYEITLESGSGSAAGRPTGPVLYKGTARLAVRDLSRGVGEEE